MDTLEYYRNAIKELLTRFSRSSEEIESQILFDTEHDHYQLTQVGWKNKHRIYGCVLHLDIKGGKIWIQHNGTECEIAHELVKMGIPKDHIVLGFQSPFKRQFTDFATA